MVRSPLYAALFLALAAAVPFATLGACTDETIVLATIAAVDGGGGHVDPPTRCLDSQTCENGYYCAKTSCDPTVAGTCTLPPTVCEGIGELAVCGCDNLTYFNDCLRQANGVSSYTTGPCDTNPYLCGGPDDEACPDGGSVCAQLGFSHGPCDQHLPGTCWVLPPSCPVSSGASEDRWNSCAMNGSQCVDTCTAIRIGGGYHRAQNCP